MLPIEGGVINSLICLEIYLENHEDLFYTFSTSSNSSFLFVSVMLPADFIAYYHHFINNIGWF